MVRTRGRRLLSIAAAAAAIGTLAAMPGTAAQGAAQPEVVFAVTEDGAFVSGPLTIGEIGRASCRERV